MKWTCGPSHSARALILTEKIAYEYSNNRNWLMSKMEQNSAFLVKGLQGSLTNFYCFNIHNVISLLNEDFLGFFLLGIKNWMKWTCGPSHSARALILTEKIAYEYSNNRNWLMSKMEQNSAFLVKGLQGSLTNFYCFNIHNVISLWKWGFSWIFLARYKELDEMNMWSKSQRKSSYINGENRLWIFKQ